MYVKGNSMASQPNSDSTISVALQKIDGVSKSLCIKARQKQRAPCTVQYNDVAPLAYRCRNLHVCLIDLQSAGALDIREQRFRLLSALFHLRGVAWCRADVCIDNY